MSIFDSVSNMVNQASGGADHAAVAGGLLEHLGGAGGVASLIQSMHQNGAGGLVQQWATARLNQRIRTPLSKQLAGRG